MSTKRPRGRSADPASSDIGLPRTRTNTRLDWGSAEREDNNDKTATRTTTNTASSHSRPSLLTSSTSANTGTSPVRRSQTHSIHDGGRIHFNHSRTRGSTALVETVVLDDEPQRDGRKSLLGGGRSRPDHHTATPSAARAERNNTATWLVSSSSTSGGSSTAASAPRPGTESARAPPPPTMAGRRDSVLSIDKSDDDEVGGGGVITGVKRPRPQSSAPANHHRPPRSRARPDPAVPSSPQDAERDAPSTSMPTPPPRKFTVLTSTPAFIRRERRMTDDDHVSSSHHREERTTNINTNNNSRAQSTLARGFSHLRESVSYVLAAATPVARSARESEPMPQSPWGLSSIRAPTSRNTAMRSVDSSSLGHYLLPDDGEREEARKRGGGGGGSRTTHRWKSSVKDGVRGAPPADADADEDDELAFLGPATGRGSGRRFAANLSSLSESLPDMMSSSPSSVRRSLPLLPRTASVQETLLEPDVSPIVKATTGRRKGGVTGKQQQQAVSHAAAAVHGRHINMPHLEAALLPPPPLSATEPLHTAAQQFTTTRHHNNSNPHRLYAEVGKVTRLLVKLCFFLISLCLYMSLALPLLADGLHPDMLLTRYYVNPVAELHALYQIPPASLSQAAVEKLYVRVLGESLERLERATLHMKPATPSSMGVDPHARRLATTSTHAERIVFLRQMMNAYEAAQLRTRIYVRSRDESLYRRLIAYPLGDVWRYALRRHGTALGLPALFSREDVFDRVVNAVGCLSGHEGLPCPTRLFEEQAMVVAAKAFTAYHDVNAAYETAERRSSNEMLANRLQRDADSEVYMETLLTYVKKQSLKVSRA